MYALFSPVRNRLLNKQNEHDLFRKCVENAAKFLKNVFEGASESRQLFTIVKGHVFSIKY